MRTNSAPIHASRSAKLRVAEKIWMNRSRRKNFNTINAPSLARWIVITAFLGLTGLSYVYLTLQLYHLGDRNKALENELAEPAHAERRRQRADRGAHLALRFAAPIEGRLPENDSDLRAQHRATDHSARVRDEDAIQPVVNQRAGK